MGVWTVIGKKVRIEFSVGRHQGRVEGKIVRDCGLGLYEVRVPSWAVKMFSEAEVKVFGDRTFLWADEFTPVGEEN